MFFKKLSRFILWLLFLGGGAVVTLAVVALGYRKAGPSILVGRAAGRPSATAPPGVAVPILQGGQNPYPASEAVAELRKAKIKLWMAPVVDAQGKPVADQFVELKDSYTTKVTKLSRKLAEGKKPLR